jgi:transposase
MWCDRIVPPLVLDGAINGRAFRAWVEQVLAPALQPGNIVIADNLASHKSLPLRRRGSPGCARPSRRAAPA